MTEGRTMSDPWGMSRVVTTREDRPSRRVSEKGSAQRTIWYRTYKQRIRDGLEHCRWCSSERRRLTFGHILAHSRGGQYKFDNITILCELCNTKMHDRTWPGLRSLQDEEKAAPPERRWAALAWEAERERAKAQGVRVPMSLEREAMVPWVMAVLIGNGPDGKPMSAAVVRERLRLPLEDETTVLAALRAARRRGYAVLAPDTESGTYLCIPGATVPELVTERTA